MASARDTLAQPQRDAQPQGGLWDVRPGHSVVRDPQVLHPHPLYTALCGPIAAIRAQRVAADDGPIREPLTITADGTILDGHARWQVACERRDSSLPCLVYNLTEEDALQLLVQRHRSVQGLNAYGRVVLALQLEPYFRGQKAGRVDTRLPPSMLTKGSHVDVRADIARVAGVSTGNVTKVKQILSSGIREVRERLLRSEVSIHRASQWRTRSPKAQRDALWTHLHRGAIKRTAKRLVNAHVTVQAPDSVISAPDTVLRSLATRKAATLTVGVLDAPGHAVLVTRELYEALQQADR